MSKTDTPMHTKTHCLPLADGWKGSPESDCRRRWCNDCDYHKWAGMFNILQTVMMACLLSYVQAATYWRRLRDQWMEWARLKLKV